jgi:hypothetical protein
MTISACTRSSSHHRFSCQEARQASYNQRHFLLRQASEAHRVFARSQKKSASRADRNTNLKHRKCVVVALAQCLRWLICQHVAALIGAALQGVLLLSHRGTKGAAVVTRRFNIDPESVLRDLESRAEERILALGIRLTRLPSPPASSPRWPRHLSRAAPGAVQSAVT